MGHKFMVVALGYSVNWLLIDILYNLQELAYVSML